MQQRLLRFFSPYRTHFRETLSLSIPVIIGQLGFVMMGFIDSLMIGDIGYVHLSASALANGIFFILSVIGMGISFALTPLVAEADAAGKLGRVGDLFRNGLYVAMATSFILGILIYFSAEILPFLDQPAEDIALAETYLRILSISTLPLLVFMALKQFADGLSYTRLAMYITLAGLVVNAGANWVLIYGKFGLPRLELDGAGYGTLFSRVFMMVAMFIYVLRNQAFAKYKLQEGWRNIKEPIIKKILSIGLPSGFQHFFEVAAFVGCTVIIGWLGETASADRAAHQIVLQMISIAFMVAMGFSAGATIRVGNALGKKDYPNVQRAGLTGVFLAVGFMACSATTLVLGRNIFPAFFNDTPYVLEVSARLMIIGALFQLFDGIQAVGVGILRGIQDVVIPTVITFVAYWVINLPLGYLFALPMGMGVDGIWYSFVVSLIVSASLLMARFMRMTNKMAKDNQPIPSDTSIEVEEAKATAVMNPQGQV